VAPRKQLDPVPASPTTLDTQPASPPTRESPASRPLPTTGLPVTAAAAAERLTTKDSGPPAGVAEAAPRPPVYTEAPLARPLVPRPPVERWPAPAPARLDVHIGTIEIHPVETLAPAPAAATAPTPMTAGGFDEFLALRRYEPWVR